MLSYAQVEGSALSGCARRERVFSEDVPVDVMVD